MRPEKRRLLKRKVIRLSRTGKYSSREVAKKLNISESTVSKYLTQYFKLKTYGYDD